VALLARERDELLEQQTATSEFLKGDQQLDIRSGGREIGVLQLDQPGWR
jgi:hypothetical protein